MRAWTIATMFMLSPLSPLHDPIDRIDHIDYITFDHFRIKRKCNDRFVVALSFRTKTSSIAQTGVVRMPVYRNVMDINADVFSDKRIEDFTSRDR
ncbi:hypothetical protein SA87_08425 [Hydrogenibacillus schlegelii]|uniref:Uncharacterized protein n=1 Tax=Hydrogenibacillus schlegelii TaxID=1484 RepID=A0A179IUC2_HYDSH|nr:hypothetical protein SA87_08425 [Hydrogenibacillus schlegelii]